MKNYTVKSPVFCLNRRYILKTNENIYIFSCINSSFISYAEEPSFKFTFGSNLGKIPLEINNISKNKKQLTGFKVNNWILSPNIHSFVGNKLLPNFLEKRNSKDKVYIKINFKF